MSFFNSVRHFVSTLFHRSELSAEADEELRSHIQLRADDLERGGLSRSEAERRARIEFGGHARFKEESLEAAGGTLIESIYQDVRYALRLLRKSPGFSAVAAITLALGIGANAVVFSMMNALILNPPVNLPDAKSLYTIQREGLDELVRHDPSQSYPDYLDLRDRNHSFDGLAAFNVAQAGLDSGDNPSSSWVYEVSGNYFDVLEIQPYLGRFFHASDEHGPNSAPYIVLSYAYWHVHFQDDRNVVGRRVQLNKHPFTILGVAPAGFHGNILIVYPDFFVPIANSEQVEGSQLGAALNARDMHWVFMTVGHLKAGVTPAKAVADLNSIGAELGKQYPKEDGNLRFSLARPTLYGDYMGGPVRAFMTGLTLLAGLILLAGCANLGSLFAARAAERSREIALRMALGSTRARVLRQLFTEAMLISLLGGALGMWAGAVVLQWLSVWQPFPTAPVVVLVNPDARVYAMAALLTLVSAFLFGAFPVRQVLRTDPHQIIKSGSLERPGRRITVRDLSLVVQVAICAVLVTSSLVAVRGMLRSLHSNFGFEPRNAMLVEGNLTMGGYTGDGVAAMEKRMIDAVQAIPGVASVGMIDPRPLVGGWNDTDVFLDTAADLRLANAAAEVVTYTISPEYFRAAPTALLAGRGFTWNDDANSPRVAVVNREFGARVFGSAANATGKYFKLQDGTRIQVIGIVEDGKHKIINEDSQAAMYFPLLQAPRSEFTMVVRSGRDPQELANAITVALRGLDSGLPFSLIGWEKALDTAMFSPRVAAVSLGVLGVMGAILSITGIFGLAAYAVSKRKRELGIRIALGAQRRELLQAALGRAFKLLAIGSAGGLVLGLLATKVLAVIVYQASPRDPLVLAGVVVAMFLLGLIATWIPARRALSIDPLILLRED